MMRWALFFHSSSWCPSRSPLAGERVRAHLRLYGDRNERGVALNEAEVRAFLGTEYARLVNGLALVYGSFPAAEDAVQEALARAWELSERGRHIDAPRAWVTQVARNLLRDRFRRSVAERRARSRLPAPSVRSAATEGTADVQRAVAALPKRQREVAVLRYYLEFEVSEIAATLRIPEGTVKSTLHRARRSLAAALREDDDQEMEARDVAH
jgi:RNA polymerase sigma-70 factor (ECF subfamily)